MAFKRRKMIAQRKTLKIKVVETTQNKKNNKDVPAQTEWIENNKEIKKSTNRRKKN